MLHLGRPLLAAVTTLVLVAAACGEDPAPTPVPPTQQPSPEATATAAPTQPSALPTSQPPAAAAPVEAIIAPTVELAAEIKNFILPDLEVKIGTRVTWTNRDRSPHTSTSGSTVDPTGIWGSGILGEGEVFSFEFAETGTFNYYCTVHPDTMNSIITVVAADQSVPPREAAWPLK